MHTIRIMLETILELADDSNQSHMVRMLRIKGIASQALTELNNAPIADKIKGRRGRPAGSKNLPKSSGNPNAKI